MDADALLTLLIGIALGLVAGSAGAWGWMRYGPGARGDADARRRERAYRQEVADHFVKTAELVNRLTDSYKEVFDHLRGGAHDLVEEETLRRRLAKEEEKDVTLHLIGYGSRSPKRAGKPGRGDRRAGGDEGE